MPAPTIGRSDGCDAAKDWLFASGGMGGPLFCCRRYLSLSRRKVRFIRFVGLQGKKYLFFLEALLDQIHQYLQRLAIDFPIPIPIYRAGGIVSD